MIMQNTLTHYNISLDHDTAIMEHYRQEQPWGLATSIDLQECNPALIRSAEHIRAFVDALCILIEMKKFGPTVVVDFGEDPRVSGFSMTRLIETSLISGHFANQSNAAYIDIFSCKAYLPSVAAAFAREFFDAQEVRVSIHFRY
jgi:S-adenosylmethionine/arginine decarboxylase-like enzyme